MLRAYVGFIMKRCWRFVATQQLLVQGVFLVFFAVFQWRSGAFRFDTWEGAGRSVWPYLGAGTICWCWLCWLAGSDLNKSLESEVNEPRRIYTGEPTQHISVRYPGPIMALLFSVPMVMLFAVSTCGLLLWVQPWRITPVPPSVPDITHTPDSTAPQQQISRQRRLKLRNQLGSFLSSEVMIRNGCLTPPTQPKSACIENVLNWLRTTYAFIKGSMDPSYTARLLAAPTTIQNYEGANGDHEINIAISAMESRGRMIDEFIRELQ